MHSCYHFPRIKESQCDDHSISRTFNGSIVLKTKLLGFQDNFFMLYYNYYFYFVFFLIRGGQLVKEGHLDLQGLLAFLALMALT